MPTEAARKTNRPACSLLSETDLISLLFVSDWGRLLSFQTDQWVTDYRSPWVAAICYLGHINRTYRKKRVVSLDVWVPPSTSSFLRAPGSSTCRREWAGEVLNGTRAGLSFSTSAVSCVTRLSYGLEIINVLFESQARRMIFDFNSVMMPLNK